MFVSDLLFVNTLMSSLRDIKVFTKKEKENEGVGAMFYYRSFLIYAWDVLL